MNTTALNELIAAAEKPYADPATARLGDRQPAERGTRMLVEDKLATLIAGLCELMEATP